MVTAVTFSVTNVGTNFDCSCLFFILELTTHTRQTDGRRDTHGQNAYCR